MLSRTCSTRPASSSKPASSASGRHGVGGGAACSEVAKNGPNSSSMAAPLWPPQAVGLQEPTESAGQQRVQLVEGAGPALASLAHEVRRVRALPDGQPGLAVIV